MPLIHQQNGLNFFIESDFPEPPHVRIIKEKGLIIIRIGIPEIELPFIEKYDNVSREDMALAYDIIWDHQGNFLLAWAHHHNLAPKLQKLPFPLFEKTTGSKRRSLFMEEVRLPLKSKARKERVKEALGGIFDKRFILLQKRLISDLDKANFKTVSLGNYLRLGGWSHTGGSYMNTMVAVEALCKAMFGYQIPEKIGSYFMKANRYRSAGALIKIAPIIVKFHQERMKKPNSTGS